MPDLTGPGGSDKDLNFIQSELNSDRRLLRRGGVIFYLYCV